MNILYQASSFRLCGKCQQVHTQYLYLQIKIVMISIDNHLQGNDWMIFQSQSVPKGQAEVFSVKLDLFKKC